jgi:hypothetical protein
MGMDGDVEPTRVPSSSGHDQEPVTPDERAPSSFVVVAVFGSITAG